MGNLIKKFYYCRAKMVGKESGKFEKLTFKFDLYFRLFNKIKYQ